jgi:hypothetical protein
MKGRRESVAIAVVAVSLSLSYPQSLSLSLESSAQNQKDRSSRNHICRYQVEPIAMTFSERPASIFAQSRNQDSELC